jgi:hypothetical protein
MDKDFVGFGGNLDRGWASNAAEAAYYGKGETLAPVGGSKQ